jgi:hypothetical protein
MPRMGVKRETRQITCRDLSSTLISWGMSGFIVIVVVLLFVIALETVERDQELRILSASGRPR